MLDPNIFSKYKTKQDFDREREEFEFRKRKRALEEQLGGLKVQQAQQQLNTPEQLGMEQLLAKSIQLGGVQNLTPQEQAQLQAFDIAQRTKQSVDPRGNIVSNRSVFDMLPGQINRMPPAQVMNMPVGVQNDPMLANQQAAAAQADMLGAPDMRNTTPVFDPLDYGVTSPYGQEDLRKAQAMEAIKQQAETSKAQKENEMAYNTFITAIDNIEKTMQGTATNPFVGSLPAVTSEAQIAEGAVAVMAPILKQLFREAGEGTFTEKDQEILMNMLPTRKDFGAARAAKLQMVKDTVAAKLGKTVTPPAGSVDDLLNKYAPVN